MKTFTAIYHWPDGTEARATASFASLPGVAPIEWSGNTAPFIARHGKVFTTGYAETITRDLRQFGVTAGAEVEIVETGKWKAWTM